METKELIQSAIDRKFTNFDAKTKELLSAKVAAKLQEKGYFNRLNNAKGVFEEFGKDEDEDEGKKSEDKDSDDKDDKDSDKKDDKKEEK